MSLKLSRDQRNEMLSRWYDVVVGGYPAETARFLREQADQFANPVGAALREELGPILDGILDGRDPGELEPHLDRILRVRALQDMAPSRAVDFLLDLKEIFGQVVNDGSSGIDNAFEHRVDAALLTAFDVFSRCREQVYEIRVNEIRNRSLKVMERLNSWREARAGRSRTDA